MGYYLLSWEGAPPSLDAISERMRGEGLQPHRWSNGPGDAYSEHTHSYRKVLFCVEGSITFEVTGDRVTLAPGDRLELDPDTPHSAVVGPQGVVCMEAQASGQS